MKQLLTLTLLFTITNICMSQTLSGRLISGKTSDLGEPISKLLIQSPTDNFDKIQYYDHQRRQVLRLNSKGDTIEITSPFVKFIKIDGKIYEIRRNTELKEVKSNWTVSFGEVAIRIDTTLGIRSHNKPTKQ